MSTSPDPQVDASQVEQVRRQINRLAEEVAQLSEMDLAPAEYYGEFLQRVLQALAAPAGAVWLRTPQGNLQLQYQINMRQIGLDRGENSRQMHDELLRNTAMKAQPTMVPPQSSVGQAEGTAIVPGNPTDFVILLAPIFVDKQVAGLVEIWQDPRRGPDAQRGFLQFVVRMSGLASGYTRNHQLRQMVGQQQVWVQLESFAKQIHGSLNPLEVGYLVANEGRRLAEADRVSVAIRYSRKPQVLSISGADVIEKRSNLVRLMRQLFESVMAWGERLVYSGTKDESLPPAVLKSLDAFLAESNSKLLVVLPLRDDREKDSKQPCRAGLMMESFEPATTPEQMFARLEVVGRHATSALYNAAEYRRIPMRFLWLPLAKLQDGLGGKARAILTLVAVGLSAFLAAMIFIRYPLKMEANGQLLPRDRSWIYPEQEGHVKEIKGALKSGSKVYQGMELIRMFDLELAKKINSLQLEIAEADAIISNLRNPKESEKSLEVEKARITKEAKVAQLDALRSRTNASSRNPGEFFIRSPMTGIILSSDFRETLINRFVRPNEPLLRIGKVDITNPRIAEWEIELKIPQKHIGQVLYAFEKVGDELDVDILLTSQPTSSYRGKLIRGKVASQATANMSENQESEPVVLGWVRIHGDDIPEDAALPVGQLLTGTEVHTRIRCGSYAMGYSLFYGVWEFIYEKIVFFF